MRFWRIIAIATTAEMAITGAAAAMIGLAGLYAPIPDVLNNFAPIWLLLSLIGAGGAALVMPVGRARSAVVWLGLAGALLSAFAMAPETLRLLSPWPPVKGVQTRVVSFNTWSQNDDPDAAIRLICTADADVVTLIEMPPQVAHRLDRLARLYPYRSIRKAGCPLDLVILSKRPLSASGCEVVAATARPSGAFGLVWGRTTGADGLPLTVATTHYTWPARARLMRLQRRALLAFTRRWADPDLIVTGDFNLTPWSYTLKRQDSDLWPLVRADRALFTWPAEIPKIGARAPFPLLPIDHIYAGPGWQTVSARRLAAAGSDHYGIEASLVRSSISR